jgi:glycosyltransferase involved in cell wall biosynthesis
MKFINKKNKKPNVKIISIGRFHHFNLARQLQKFDILESIHSGYPKFKLNNEKGIPKYKIKTFPYLETIYQFLIRYFPSINTNILQNISNFSHKLLSKNTAKSINSSNILIASARAGLEAGKSIQKKGGIYICDRGSTHIAHQNKILKDEYKKFGLTFKDINKSKIEREISEYKEADMISIASKFVQKTFIKHGINRKKLFINPYGVNTKIFSKRKKANTNKFIILFVGRIGIRKGIFYLINAFNKLKILNKKLIFVGSIENNIKNRFQDSLCEQIIHIKHVNSSKLAQIYSNSDIFVNPAIEEGLSLVIPEAMACGCVVIATENTGASDFYKNNHAGFIIKARSENILRKKIYFLYKNEKIRKKMSQNALNTVKNINGWDQYGKNWYKKLNFLSKKIKYKSKNQNKY